MYYIAYGSNLPRAAMERRCPGCAPAGTGRLEGWRLDFFRHATVTPCEGASVPVAVYEIGPDHLRALDEYEGWPVYYTREEVCVRLSGGGEVRGLIYVMDPGMQRPVLPDADYLDGMVRAYSEHRFPRGDLAALFEALAHPSQPRQP